MLHLPQDTLGSSVLAVKVNVLPANPPDSSLKPAIDNLETLRADREKDMFESVRACSLSSEACLAKRVLLWKAAGELSALTTFVMNELEACTRPGAPNVFRCAAAAAAGTNSITC